jgi:hypothetical protein
LGSPVGGRTVYTDRIFCYDVSKTEAVANIGEKLFLERAQVYRRKDKALKQSGTAFIREVD